jgi:hypothetical protein
MWDGAKNMSSKRTSSFTKSHAMRGNGTEGKTPQGGKSQTIPGLEIETQGELCKEGGFF